MIAVTRKLWRRRNYTGQYTGAVRPATWQEKMVSLRAGLASAIAAGSPHRIAICQRAIIAHAALNPEDHDRRLGLLPERNHNNA